LQPNHAKSFYDLLSEDAFEQEQDVNHLKCIRRAIKHFQVTRKTIRGNKCN